MLNGNVITERKPTHLLHSSSMREKGGERAVQVELGNGCPLCFWLFPDGCLLHVCYSTNHHSFQSRTNGYREMRRLQVRETYA